MEKMKLLKEDKKIKNEYDNKILISKLESLEIFTANQLITIFNTGRLVNCTGIGIKSYIDILKLLSILTDHTMSIPSEQCLKKRMATKYTTQIERLDVNSIKCILKENNMYGRN